MEIELDLNSKMEILRMPTDTHVSYNPLNQADLIDIVGILFFFFHQTALSLEHGATETCSWHPLA